MHWYPTSNLGKISFLSAVLAWALIYVQFWVAMAFDISIPPPVGILALLFLITGGIGSVVAIAAKRDRAVLLFFSAFIGCLGIALVLGEILVPH